MRRVAHHVLLGQQPIGLEAAASGGIRRRLVQPEVDVPGIELAHGLKLQIGPAAKRDQLVAILGMRFQFLSPMGLELLAWPVGHLALQPSGADDRQLELPVVIRRPRSIAKVWPMKLTTILPHEHLLGIFQVNLAIAQVILQLFGLHAQMVAGRGDRSRRAAGLDAGGLQIETRRGLFSGLGPALGAAGRVKKMESNSQPM